MYSPCGKEAAVSIQQQEELVAGLVAVAGVQEVLQRHGALGGADDVDVLALRPPDADTSISQAVRLSVQTPNSMVILHTLSLPVPHT